MTIKPRYTFLFLFSFLFLVACSNSDSTIQNDLSSEQPDTQQTEPFFQELSRSGNANSSADANPSSVEQGQRLPELPQPEDLRTTASDVVDDPLRDALGLEEGILPAAVEGNYLTKDRCEALLSGPNESYYQECMSSVDQALNFQKLEEEVLKTNSKDDCNQFAREGRLYQNCIYLNGGLAPQNPVGDEGSGNEG